MVDANSHLILQSTLTTDEDNDKAPIKLTDFSYASDLDNKVFQYDPVMKSTSKRSRASQSVATADNNIIKSNLYPDLERELQTQLGGNIDSNSNNKQVRDEKEPARKPVSTAATTSSNGNDARASLKDKINAIGFNTREVRLVGPNAQPIEMKNDMSSQVVIAWENLQKEASAGWDTLQKEASAGWDNVRDQLDKGWNGFKTMVGERVSRHP